MENISAAAYWADKALAVVLLCTAAWCLWKRGDAFRLKLSAMVLLGFLGLFTGLRVALWAGLSDFFAACPSVPVAFARGVRFDLAALGACAGVFVWALNFPVRRDAYYRICLTLAAVVFALVFLLGAGDIVYFHFVKRHAGTELLLMFNDLDLVGGLALLRYAWAALGWLVLSALGIWGAWKKFGVRGQARPAGTRLETACIILTGVLLFFAFRGMFGFRFRPLAPQAAYEDGRLECGHLALNGVFNAYKSVSKKYAPVNTLVSSQDALGRARELLSSAQETIPDEAYPLRRARRAFNAPGKGKNLIILLLESWEARYTDALAGTSYGATPNLDALIRESAVFTRFYASGQRSINGAGTVLTGVPQLPGLPYYSLGLEVYDVSGLADILSQSGYRTVFVQPSEWRSAGVGRVAELAGFEEIYSRPHVPSQGGYLKEGIVSDYDALMLLADKLEEGKKPFLGFFFSAAMHPPFAPLRAEFCKYPWDGPDGGYLNALNYTDWAVGQFVGRLKKAGIYEDAVLIILADHTLGWGDGGGSFSARFKIPLVIRAPGLLTAGERAVTGSQADVLPTVLDILNVSRPYSALGNSLLDASAPHFAYSSMDGRILGWKEADVLVAHTGRTRVFAEPSGRGGKQAEENLLSFTRAAYDLLKSGRWAPPPARR